MAIANIQNLNETFVHRSNYLAPEQLLALHPVSPADESTMKGSISSLYEKNIEILNWEKGHFITIRTGILVKYLRDETK